MNRIYKLMTLVVIVASAFVFLGCENWEEAQDFNTSQGAGSSVNLSGTYKPREKGGILAGSNVTYIVITQTGNALEGNDNLGSKYTGSIGSPGIQSAPGSDGTYPAGSEMLQSQVSFSGVNKGSGESVDFVGIIRALAVTDVKETTQTIDPGEEGAPVTTTTYTINEANTEYSLEGSWTEGSANYEVNAYCKATSGTF